MDGQVTRLSYFAATLLMLMALSAVLGACVRVFVWVSGV